MMGKRYHLGYLGAVDVLGAPSNLAVVVRVNNVDAVMKKEGGVIGEGLTKLLPQANVESLFYSKMQGTMQEEFKKKGIDANVEVVQASVAPSGAPPALWQQFAIGVAVGLAVELLVTRLWKSGHQNVSDVLYRPKTR